MSISIDRTQLLALQEELQRLAETDFAPLLDAIGQQQEDSARRRIFETKHTPDGVRWPSWSERYAKTRGPQHSLLRSTGALGDSMTHVVRSDARFQRGGYVLVGSPLVYAATHLFGDPDRRIPARPYLDTSGQLTDTFDREEIDDLITDFLEGIL